MTASIPVRPICRRLLPAPPPPQRSARSDRTECPGLETQPLRTDRSLLSPDQPQGDSHQVTAQPGGPGDRASQEPTCGPRLTTPTTQPSPETALNGRHSPRPSDQPSPGDGAGLAVAAHSPVTSGDGAGMADMRGAGRSSGAGAARPCLCRRKWQLLDIRLW